MERSTGLLSFVATGWRAIFAFFQPLYEADGGAGEIPFCTQLVFEETLKVEVQGLLLIGEEQKDRHFNFERFLENRSEEHTSELQSPDHLVCRLLLEKKKKCRHRNMQGA